MSTDDLKIATSLFQNCSMGGKEPNKADTRMKRAEREDEESIKRKRKTELSEPQNTLCPFLPQAFAHAIAST